MSAVDRQIQTNVTAEGTPNLLRGSDGTLYTVYDVATNTLRVSYSTDGGLTWTEASTAQTVAHPAAGIDSNDVIHIAWTEGAGTACKYRQYTISGGFTAVETVATAASLADAYVAFGVDSADNVHVAFTDFSGGIRYNKRTSGTWGSVSTLASGGTARRGIQMAIDSSNFVYIVYNLNTTPSAVKYLKYTSSWTSEVQIGTTGSTANGSFPTITIDSADNGYVVWSGGNVLRYAKYTAATDSWAPETVVTTTATTLDLPGIGVDASDVVSALFEDAVTFNDGYIIQNTAGTWGSDSKIIDVSNPQAVTYMRPHSTVWPLVGGVHTNVPTSGYAFTYVLTVSGTPTLRFYSSPASYPAPQTQDYSRAAAAALPSTDNDLSHVFSTTEYTQVASQDSIYADQTATNQYAIIEFKNKNASNTAPISVSWTGKTNIAPSTSTVYLQIYNRNSATWETLGSNSSAAINTNFTISGTQTTSLSNYYSAQYWVSCRVYQLAQ